MRLTHVALGTVTSALIAVGSATALDTDSARAALFAVNGPDATETWTAGRFQTVNWNVATSKAAPVNAAAVRITLSLDGGATFPVVLAASTENDGSELVGVPMTARTEHARVKVEAVGNRFFADVSDEDFSIVGGTGPNASVGDASVLEGNSGTTPVSVAVSLSATSATPVTVDYTTAPGTATAPSDYAIATGTLTFAPGETSRLVTLSVVGDTTVEPHESFFLNISNLSGGGTITDAQGEITILNDDGSPTLSIADASTIEGNSGTTNAVHAVTLSVASASNVTVDYATADGTATAGTDYTSASGTITFAPGSTVQNVTVSITGETAVEADETYFVNLTNPVGATILDGQGLGTIVNDDGAAAADQTGELSHGFRITEDLAAQGGNADVDTYAISQKAFSSYEVVVDATSGDITPVALELIDASSAVVASSVPVGTGTTQSRSLRFQNTTSADIDTQAVRVQSGDCTTDCGTDDTYRLRAYETTNAIPRFNNSSTQVTLIVLQNPADYTINARLYFWDATGTQLHVETQTLAPKGVLIFNTASIVALQGVSGTVTVAHDGRHGDLVGKGVALEPATGFSFDSPMLPRTR